MCPDVVEDSLHPVVRSSVMVFLEENNELVRVLEFDQGLVDHVSDV